MDCPEEKYLRPPNLIPRMNLGFDENQSFFAKVEAVTEGRCNSKFMDTLLKNLRTATTSAEKQLGTSELLARYSFTQNVTNNNFWLQAHTVPLDY